MNSYLYKKSDAFTSSSSSGNPAACLYLKNGQVLSPESMLAIAKEHKGFVSEVVYCTPLGSSQYRLRYYSSECEVEFCGHGTIACMYDLIKSDFELLRQTEITITTNKGDLTVYNDISTADAVFITAPDMTECPVHCGVDDIARNLCIPSDKIDQAFSIECIDAGLRTLIVPIVDLVTALGMHPDETKLKAFCVKEDIDIILIFTPETVSEQNKMRTRVFAPRFGYLEDPATGSGNSSFGHYMLKNGMWNGEMISIEQNGEQTAFNIVKLKEKSGKVLFGGKATTRIKGEYFLESPLPV